MTNGPTPSVAFFLGYAVGGLGLIALAAPAPKTATTITLVLLVTVLFIHADGIDALLTNAQNALGNIPGAPSHA